jgi:hypothetical protein
MDKNQIEKIEDSNQKHERIEIIEKEGQQGEFCKKTKVVPRGFIARSSWSRSKMLA